jgi:hypothetical protein
MGFKFVLEIQIHIRLDPHLLVQSGSFRSSQSDLSSSQSNWNPTRSKSTVYENPDICGGAPLKTHSHEKKCVKYCKYLGGYLGPSISTANIFKNFLILRLKDMIFKRSSLQC